MKKNYNFKINPKLLESDKIAHYQNFDKLLNEFQNTKKDKKPLFVYSRKWIYSAVAVAAAFIGLLFIVNVNSGDDYLANQKEHFSKLPYINPPFENVKPQFASYKVKANQGGIYEYKSGSKLNVPAAAFVDQNGEIVNGDVDIKYREFHDYVDFFLSGIPMTYDSAGISYTLESAGMMEIYAEQDGQRIKMAPGKTIAVELVSNINVPPGLDQPPGYNIYKLDTSKRNWVYKNVDKMQFFEENELSDLENQLDEITPETAFENKMAQLDKKANAELAEIEASIPKPQEPAKPKRDNGSGEAFSFDISELEDDIAQEYTSAKQEATELSQEFSSMVWQINPTSDVKLDKIASPEDGSWDGMRLRKVNNVDFELTLIEGNQAIKVIINPVLSGSDYNRAMEEYEHQMSSFTAALDAREQKLAEEKAIWEEAYEEQKRVLEDQYQQDKAKLERYGDTEGVTNLMLSRKVVNRFNATSLGIWNCDRPLPPYAVILDVNFKDQHGNLYDNHTAYLVDKSRNTVSTFYAQGKTQLQFNRNSENLLWIVSENKLAVLRPEDFKMINVPKGYYDLTLDLVDREVNSEEDARQILYF